MPSETVTLFFALLACALVAGLVALGAAAASGRVPGAVAAVTDVSLELATLIAVVSTVGSLYLSEVANFTPCRLCWVQRGFMYPAAVFLVAAIVTRHRFPVAIAGILAVIGLPVALFHRYEQAAGEIGGLCEAANPCSAQWVSHFGFITIPTMAAAGFVGVAVFATLHLRRSS